MRIVDSYGINDGGLIYSVELAEDRFVDVKVCDGKLGGLIYVMQNEDGSTVYSDKAYTDKGVDSVYPGFEYDEKEVLALVRASLMLDIEQPSKNEKYGADNAGAFVAQGLIRAMQEDGITLAQVSEELNYRECASVQDGRAGWDDSLIEYSTKELEFIEAAWASMETEQGKVRVAIESTDDYSDSAFHSRLVDSDVKNEDGTYGRLVESYRIVSLNQNGRIDKFDDRVFVSPEAARNTVLNDARLVLVGYDDLVHEAGKGLQVVSPPQPEKESAEEKLVNISDLEYEDGYLHFRVYADGYALEGLYRLYDPENGPDMTLVSIDYGYLHPIIERQWSRIEESLYESSLTRYHAILDKSEAFKEKVIQAMEAAGYTYDVLESYDGWHRFLGEGGASIGFDALHEAAEWLEGVVFDDPDVARNVEEALRPERCEAQSCVSDVLADAARRASDAPVFKNEEFVKD